MTLALAAIIQEPGHEPVLIAAVSSWAAAGFRSTR